MREVILLSAIFILGLTGVSSAESIRGVYRDLDQRMIYTVETDGRDVLIRRGHYGRWQRFASTRRDVFVNRAGDRLLIRRRGLELQKRHYSVRLVPVERNRFAPNSNHRIDRRRGMDGLWFAYRGRSELRITEYRNGIKVRFLGRRNATQFFRLVENWDRIRVYQSDCGQTLTLRRNGQLTWTDASGRRQMNYYK